MAEEGFAGHGAARRFDHFGIGAMPDGLGLRKQRRLPAFRVEFSINQAFFFGNPFVTCSPFNFLFNNDDEYENVVFKPMDEYNSDYLIPSSFFFGDAYPCYRKFRPVCTHGDG